MSILLANDLIKTDHTVSVGDLEYSAIIAQLPSLGQS